MTKELKLSPSYLLIGSELHIEAIAKNFIKNIFCSDVNIAGKDSIHKLTETVQDSVSTQSTNASCNACIECKKIDRTIHHNVIWLRPESSYTTSDLEPIFKAASFALPEDKQFFFVINKAQLLSPSCANSLLKLMEEPPRGYHFILTAQTKERILPTILSRCIVQNYITETYAESVFFNYFNELQEPDFKSFNQSVQAAKILESELMSLIDQIYFFWMGQLKIMIEQNRIDEMISIQNILDLMNQSRTESIMPGSGKIFLRNLYMKFILLSQGY